MTFPATGDWFACRVVSLLDEIADESESPRRICRLKAKKRRASEHSSRFVSSAVHLIFTDQLLDKAPDQV
jgi:hypothetical protein